MQNKRQKYEIFGKKILKKLGKKGDFRNFLDPIWDFSTKKGFKIRDPRIS